MKPLELTTRPVITKEPPFARSLYYADISMRKYIYIFYIFWPDDFKSIIERGIIVTELKRMLWNH